MNDRLSSTSVVGEIVRETEGFFAEHVYEFLLFLNTPLVKDSAKFIEGILCITAEGRDVLRRILSRMSMVSSATADVVLLLALPLTGME